MWYYFDVRALSFFEQEGVDNMGKSLKGKELGEGISQRSDGYYVARFRYGNGKRKQKVFTDINSAKQWMIDKKFQVNHYVTNVVKENAPDFTNTTVAEWYNYWNEFYNKDLSPNTIRNYRERFNRNIFPVIGNLRLTDVRSIHCQMILNNMKDEGYAAGTVYQTYICMGVLFKAAINNDIIIKHPLTGVTYPKGLKRKTIRALTIDEQKTFLKIAERSHNKLQYRFVLQTGLRTGEMIGLTWDRVDFDKKEIRIEKQMEYRYGNQYWRACSPKTISGFRTVPLSKEALDILMEIYKTKDIRKMAPELDCVLTYMDTKSHVEKSFNMKNLVFINYRTGMPNKSSSYDTHIDKLCKEAGIKSFGMHVLRHTFATRCIEAGMNPKTLQKILGHASIKTTMDTYVDVTNESLHEGIELLSVI